MPHPACRRLRSAWVGIYVSSNILRNFVLAPSFALVLEICNGRDFDEMNFLGLFALSAGCGIDSIDLNVPVLGRSAHQLVTHTAAHEQRAPALVANRRREIQNLLWNVHAREYKGGQRPPLSKKRIYPQITQIKSRARNGKGSPTHHFYFSSA